MPFRTFKAWDERVRERVIKRQNAARRKNWREWLARERRAGR